MRLTLPILLKLSFISGGAATAGALESRQDARCSDIKPVLALLSNIPTVTSACSSLLGYPRNHASTTVTETQTQTVKSTTATVTKTIFVTTTSPLTRVVRSRKTIVTTSTFPPYTGTHYDVTYITKTRRVPYAAAAPAPSKALKRNALNDALPGVSLQELSSACSCIVTKPTSTATTTTTKTVVKGVKATTRQTSTSTVIETFVRTNVRTVRSTSYTQFVTTKTIKTRETTTVTRCRGNNPSPWFNLQASYYPTSIDDAYQSKYLSISSDASIPEPSATQATFASDKEDATALNIDCVGRLYADGDLYPEISFNFYDFSLVSFMNQSDAELRGDYYVEQCSVDATGILRSNLVIGTQPPTNKWQTCPEYIEFYDTPVILGNYVPETHQPNCTQFEWLVSNVGV